MISLDGIIPGIVDAHVQQWNPRRTPWSTNRVSKLYRFVPRVGERVFSFAVPQAEREYVLTPRTVGRPYETRQYLADAAAVPTVVGVPIDSVVVVESYWRDGGSTVVEDPAQAEDEVRYLLGLPFGVGLGPSLGALMVRGDPRGEYFAQRLDAALAISDRVRGVQITATRHPDPKVRAGAGSDGMVASAGFLRGMAEVAERGLAAEVYVYSHQLHDVITLAREYPDTTIIVDHMGSPVGAFGPVGMRTGATAAARADILRLWRERMVGLAALPNVVVKLSGLALPVLGFGREPWGNIGTGDTLIEMVGPLVEHIVGHFGSQRAMFGSNFPIDKPNAAIDMIVGSLAEILMPWGEHMVRNIFRDNATRIYRIGSHELP